MTTSSHTSSQLNQRILVASKEKKGSSLQLSQLGNLRNSLFSSPTHDANFFEIKIQKIESSTLKKYQLRRE